VAALNNRAIFEIPGILDTIIGRHLSPIHRDAPLSMSWRNRSLLNPNGAAASWG